MKAASEEAAYALVQLGMDNEYHCIFIGPHPMFHGMGREQVQAHYENVVMVVASAFDKFRTSAWTNEKPTVPGWYWYQPPDGADPDGASVLMIYVREPIAGSGGLIAHEFEFTGNTFKMEHNRVKHYNGRWAGPIRHPNRKAAL